MENICVCMLSMFTDGTAAVSCSMRPITWSLASGSVSSLLIAAVRELGKTEPRYLAPTAQDICPILFPEDRFWGIDFKSLLLGICIGFLLGPLIDLLYFIRHSLPRLLCASPGNLRRPLYRVLDEQPRH